MRNEPTKAYVYQPMPPQEDGKFYGVGGLHQLGVDIDHRVKGITKADAQKIAEQCNQKPADAAQFIEMVQYRIDSDWRPECGCRFESIFSNAVLPKSTSWSALLSAVSLLKTERNNYKHRSEELELVIRETIEDNLDLADGENCTLIKLKRAINYDDNAPLTDE